MKEKGDVLVRGISNGFEINSSVPFILTIPSSEFDFDTALLVNNKKGIALNGKIIAKNNVRLVTFEVPALDCIELVLQ
jgi:hypothetical protein